MVSLLYSYCNLLLLFSAPFIYIRSNANLKRIIWNLEFVAHEKVQVLIYNNPLLRLEEDKIANLTEISNDESFIQNKYKGKQSFCLNIFCFFFQNVCLRTKLTQTANQICATISIPHKNC